MSIKEARDNAAKAKRTSYKAHRAWVAECSALSGSEWRKIIKKEFPNDIRMQRRVACIVWWDFIVDRTPIDTGLSGLTDQTPDAKITRAETKAALIKIGYPFYQADARSSWKKEEVTPIG